MSKRKRVGASTKPWGAPAFIGNVWDRSPSTQTKMNNFEKCPSCQSRSEVLEMSTELKCFSVVVEIGNHIRGCSVVRTGETNAISWR